MLRLALTLAALLPLTACSGGGGRGETLRVDVAADAPGGYAAALAVEAAQATLIEHDAAGQAVPGIASSWRFLDDGRSLILRLKPLKWSDERPLDASQVVTAIQRTIVSGPASPARSAMMMLDNADGVAAGRLPPARLGISAPTSRVVEIRLAAVVPGLLDWLAQPELAITRRTATLAGYRIEAGNAQPLVLLRRSPDSGPEARAGRIELAETDAPATALRRFGAGETDIVIGEGLNGLAAARAADAAALRVEPLWGSYGWLANSRSGPLADARLRRALALAIDRDRLARRLGLAPQPGIVPAALAGGAPFQPDWAALDQPARSAQAVQLLAAAGFTAATPLRLTLLLPPGDDHLAAADAVKADWAPLGVLVAVTILPQEALTRAVAKGDYDLALLQQSVPVADRAALLAHFSCAARIYCNPGADALLAAARTIDPAVRAETLGHAEAAIMADTPFIGLGTPVRWALVRADVGGWTASPAGSHKLALLQPNAAAR